MRDAAFSDGAPVAVGDLILLAASHTGMPESAWAVVELVEFHPNPGDHAWNSGPAYPYRVGYRTEHITSGGPETRLGVIWLDPAGSDAHEHLLKIGSPSVTGR